MFCEFLHAFAIIWDVNNESDDERKLYKHAEKPIKRWFTESGALIKAEMLAKWLTYHKSAAWNTDALLAAPRHRAAGTAGGPSRTKIGKRSACATRRRLSPPERTVGCPPGSARHESQGRARKLRRSAAATGDLPLRSD